MLNNWMGVKTWTVTSKNRVLLRFYDTIFLVPTGSGPRSDYFQVWPRSVFGSILKNPNPLVITEKELGFLEGDWFEIWKTRS